MNFSNSETHHFSIILHSPEIPGNTGSIGRTCLALGVPLILIHPLGFSLSQKAVRRAGLDYWKYVHVVEYLSWQAFLNDKSPPEEKIFLMESHKGESFLEAKLPQGSYLVFGAEGQGLPNCILDQYPSRIFHLPMKSNIIRSLNLSNAVCATAYCSLQKT